MCPPGLTRRRLLLAGGALAALGTAAGYSELTDRRVWSADVGSTLPVLDGDTLYVVGSDDGVDRVYALDAESGEVRWTTPRSLDDEPSRRAQIKYPPAVTDGTVYLGTDSGVFAVDPPGEETRWQFDGDGVWGAAVAVGGDAVFAGTGGADVYAIDRADGSERWHRSLGCSVTGTPIYDSGALYVPACDRVYALGADGSERWTAEADGAEELAVAADGVYVTDGHGVRAFDRDTGRQRWKAAASTVGPPAVASVDGETVVYTGGTAGATHTYRASDGEHVWYYRPATPDRSNSVTIGAPAVGGGVVYFPSDVRGHNGLYAVDAVSGGYLWSQPLSSPGIAPPAVGESRVYVADNDGTHALATESALPF